MHRPRIEIEYLLLCWLCAVSFLHKVKVKDRDWFEAELLIGWGSRSKPRGLAETGESDRSFIRFGVLSYPKCVITVRTRT